jgi:hypothetical protein
MAVITICQVQNVPAQGTGIYSESTGKPQGFQEFLPQSITKECKSSLFLYFVQLRECTQINANSYAPSSLLFAIIRAIRGLFSFKSALIRENQRTS